MPKLPLGTTLLIQDEIAIKFLRQHLIIELLNIDLDYLTPIGQIDRQTFLLKRVIRDTQNFFVSSCGHVAVPISMGGIENRLPSSLGKPLCYKCSGIKHLGTYLSNQSALLSERIL